MATARRVFVAAWVLLGIAGAMDHTIAEKLLGRRFDLLLPHLEYGHVMFNKNPHTATVYEYSRPGGERRPLAELVRTPSIGYENSRIVVNTILRPDYPKEICYRATHGTSDRFTFYIDEYDMDVDTRHPARSETLSCDAHGLVAR